MPVTNTSRLIYPYDTPLRNRYPRTQGQGTSARAKIFTGVSGTQTGSQGFGKNAFIAETSSFASWPGSLPGAGAQTAVDLTVPYKFQGLSESLSWLSQFSGQGFEDVDGLASLILLQEMMLAEEYALIGATATALTTPGTPSLSARSAHSGESVIANASTNVYVVVTATNFLGETVGSSTASVACTTAQVVDVTTKGTPLAGLSINVYAATGTADPGVYHLVNASPVGGSIYTIQGNIPSATATVPTSNTTAYANGYEGQVSVVSGHAYSQASVYPAGFMGSYVNKAVGDVLTFDVVGAALQGMWDGATTNGPSGNTFTSSGGFRANPDELIAEGADVTNLTKSIMQNASTASAYRLMIDQGSVADVTGGVAVSQFINPVTRKAVKILVHPWLPQGNALLNSYTLPTGWSNVQNVIEVNNVQDYLSVRWPVIDPTFRQSIFLYGAPLIVAPQYLGILGGLQRSNGSSTGTWS